MSGSATIDIVRAAPADLEWLSGTLARAFHDDPVLGWMIPDPARRRARLPSLFAAEAEAYLRLHETYVADDGAGAALWAPPGTRAITEDQFEAYGKRIAAILQEDLDRCLQVLELLELHHPDQPCWYLQWLGVAPEHQGRGLGGRLLATVLQRCDAIGAPAYLEATSASNRRLYERHGFQTVGEIAVPAGPSLWPMWREPVAASS